MTCRRIVIIGATSGIAEHCARLWAARADTELVLVGRSAERLQRVADDLRVRAPAARLQTRTAGFTAPADIQATVDAIVAGGPVDIVLIAHGSLPEQAQCQQDLAYCQEVLEVNGVSPALYAEAFAGALERADRGTLALIGSVAGDRGRRSNYSYGAAKGLLTRYAQGLQHRFAGSKVKVVLVKPGPTDTPMTAALKAQGARLAPVEAVAARIVAAIERGQPVVYAPGIWALIMLVIRHLPRLVFNKLNI